MLVVDDSAFMRKLIQEFLSEQDHIAVVGTARNGQDAIAKIKLLRPHVLTMDVEMPVMSGLEALQVIMKEHPLPVIMLSSTTKEGTENTLLAMDYGAVDFVAKPSGTISLDLHKVRDELVSKVTSAAGAKVQVLRKPAPTIKQAHLQKLTMQEPLEQPTTPLRPVTNSVSSRRKVVLIGASTGGPRALQEVVSALPKTIAAPVVIVQHMPAGFTKSLANRLNRLSAVAVKEAEHGDALQNGNVYLAPGGFHLTLTQRESTIFIELNENPPRNGHRPSVDTMLESVTSIDSVEKIVVILTGMGADGSKGLVQLSCKDPVITIAESQDTCIVYGMPKAAVATGLVQEILPLSMISTTIMKYLP